MSYTNSSLSCARRCLREYDLRYNKQLSPAGEDREVLQVGSTWHKAHDVAALEAFGSGEKDIGKAMATSEAMARGYIAIRKHAPGGSWITKLNRLFAAYQWKWSGDQLNLTASEHSFRIEVDNVFLEGQIDGIVEVNGQLGILERKTTSEDLADKSPFWSRLRMGTQPGMYANAFFRLTGKPPAFIMYDVVRKPTIRQKSISKAEVARMQKELDTLGVATYFGQKFVNDYLRTALEERQESLDLYGARLTADIGDRPDWYFARRIIPRTAKDLEMMLGDTLLQASYLDLLDLKPDQYNPQAFKNPDACATFGLCDFFGICSNNEIVTDKVPSGFKRRVHQHAELYPEEGTK